MQSKFLFKSLRRGFVSDVKVSLRIRLFHDCPEKESTGKLG